MSDLVLRAEHTGILKLGDHEMPCCVLNNKKRVLVQREVVYLLTGNRKGGLDRYTNAEGVKDYMPEKYVDKPHKESAIKFMAGNNIAYGYEATDVIDICDGYLKARDAKTIHPRQAHLAVQSELIIRASAKIGIEALIDEATGYEKIKEADELQTKFKAYIAEELREWTQTFPKEFFTQLYRLEGIQPPLHLKTFPKRFGRYVMRFVYDTMDQDVANWLRKNNPNPEKGHAHFQWLSEEFGYPKLTRHLMSVIGIQKASTTMENFKDNINRAYPGGRPQRLKRLQEAKRNKSLEQGQVEFTFI